MAPQRKHHDRRIVVGVDGSPSSVQALHWALGQAHLTDATVQAVIAWDLPGDWGRVLPEYPGQYAAEDATATLARVVEQATIGHEPVAVTFTAARGQPAKVLLEYAENADLLVVGNRGYGGFTGALIGSVSQHCIRHATCPVAVVRTRAYVRTPVNGRGR